MLKSNEGFFGTSNWRSIILDEGHRIKNSLTDISKVCLRLKSRFKIILTGTPVQNNLQELHALLRFLLPKVFENAEDHFEAGFTVNQGSIDIDKDRLGLVH
jgi:SNF2 family DNA or RNA helicase